MADKESKKAAESSENQEPMEAESTVNVSEDEPVASPAFSAGPEEPVSPSTPNATPPQAETTPPQEAQALSPEPFQPPEPEEPQPSEEAPQPPTPDEKPPEPTEPEPEGITLDPEEMVADAIQKDMDGTRTKKKEDEEPKEMKKSPELEKYWKAVKTNSQDFTGWTYLLQYVEQDNKIHFAREAFDEFFRLFPYCYGYWKKYADMEKRHENLDKAKEIYERGLKAIPLSVDLWTHYLNFATIHLSGDDYEKTIRTLYERAVSASGMDFRSDKLWNQYIAWEKEMNDLKRITAIYDRLLRIPTQLYAQHFENFKKFVNDNHPKDILDLDEFLKLRQEVVAKLSERADLDTMVTEEGDDDDAPPGLEPPGAPATTQKFDAAEVQEVREKIVAIRVPYHKANEEEVSKRWTFEEGIRRPYFHVKPLERAQLKNWKDYLDFEVENGSHIRAVVLFERCMIACAQYEEYWMKYAQYLEPHSVDGVRNVFRRGCTIHLTKKPNLHLAWAAFEERHGSAEEAWEILKNIESSLPGMAMLGMRRIGLERRQGNHQEAEQLFSEYVENSKTVPLKVFYGVKYARYALKVLKDKEKAVRILEEALEADPNNYKIVFQLIDVEFQTDCNESRILDLFSKIVDNTELAADVRIAFSRRRLEFMEDHGADITNVMRISREHQSLVRELMVQREKEAAAKKKERESSKEKDAHRGGSKRSADTDESSSKKRGKYETTNGSSYYGQQWNYGSSGSQYAYGDGGWGSYNSGYYH